eukprot:TRINITY_DN20723_c0_g1_i1.p1 TRINITY_DN20723_c0_g1~~TRINITY_DN20723_c0_g1_i1.p1  ORF type:complete len:495 (+),score=89.87 TRINITY_DN20723_c0_g1_i1:148-1632(+)
MQSQKGPPSRLVKRLGTRAAVLNRFHSLDKSGAGSLSFFQLYEGFQAIDETWDAPRIGALFMQLDFNGDGYVDAEEFLQAALDDELEVTEELQAFRETVADIPVVRSSGGETKAESDEEDPAAPRQGGELNLTFQNLLGVELGEIKGMDTRAATGAALKLVVAAKFRLQETVTALVLPNGEVVGPGLLDTQSAFNAALEGLEGNSLPLLCIMSNAHTYGAKGGSWDLSRSTCRAQAFGQKYGTFIDTIEERAQSASPQSGSPQSASSESVVETKTTPSMKARYLVHELLCSYFAEHLRPLIDVALSAAYGDSLNGQTHAYTHSPDMPPADLSKCRLWTRELREAIMDDEDHPLSFFYSACGSVLSVALWRIIDGFVGSKSTTSHKSVKRGPVMEVLFLASIPPVAHTGESIRLAKALEDAAVQMGCAAIAVAAVAAQGKSFWVRRLGYEIHVDLNPEATCSKDIFLEPEGELGRFLMHNMILFDDTPIVAKVFD